MLCKGRTFESIPSCQTVFHPWVSFIAWQLNIPGNVCWRDACISISPKPRGSKVEFWDIKSSKTHQSWLIDWNFGALFFCVVCCVFCETITYQPWTLIGWSCGASQPFFWKLHFLPEVYTDPMRSVENMTSLIGFWFWCSWVRFLLNYSWIWVHVQCPTNIWYCWIVWSQFSHLKFSFAKGTGKSQSLMSKC